MGHHRRNEQLGCISDFSASETIRGNADDSKNLAIDSQRLANHVVCRGKAFLPTCISNNCDRMRTRRLIFFGNEVASQKWLNAERVEIISGNQISPDAFVSVFMTYAHRAKPISHQTREHIVAIAIVFVIKVRLNSVVSAVMESAVNFD